MLKDYPITIPIFEQQEPYREFIERVKNVDIEQKLKELSLGEIESREDTRLNWVDIIGSAHTHYRYITSSLDWDKEAEIFWTAMLVETAKKNNLHPLLWPIDGIYDTIAVANPSLAWKIRTLNIHLPSDEEGRRYAHFIVDFCGSKLYTEEILKDMPSQLKTGLDIRTEGQYSDLGKQLLSFLNYKLPKIFEEEQSISNILARLMKQAPEAAEQDIKFFLATCLLLSDRQTWQNCSDNCPTYIIAPKLYHDTMNFLNRSWGWGQLDYKTRSNMSMDYPFFAFVDGKLMTHDQLKERYDGSGDVHEFAQRWWKAYEEKGCKREDFERRIAPILEKVNV